MTPSWASWAARWPGGRKPRKVRAAGPHVSRELPENGAAGGGGGDGARDGALRSRGSARAERARLVPAASPGPGAGRGVAGRCRWPMPARPGGGETRRGPGRRRPRGAELRPRARAGRAAAPGSSARRGRARGWAGRASQPAGGTCLLRCGAKARRS